MALSFFFLAAAVVTLAGNGVLGAGNGGGNLEVKENAAEAAMAVFTDQLRAAPCGIGFGDLADLVAAAQRNASACDCLVLQITQYLEGTPFYGSTVTLLSEDEGVAVCSPYVYRSGGGLKSLEATNSLMDASYGINEQQWLRVPVDTKKPVWSDPYFDEGGGNIEMETYSVPIVDGDSVLAVATTDLPISSAKSYAMPLVSLVFVASIVVALLP